MMGDFEISATVRRDSASLNRGGEAARVSFAPPLRVGGGAAQQQSRPAPTPLSLGRQAPSPVRLPGARRPQRRSACASPHAPSAPRRLTRLAHPCPRSARHTALSYIPSAGGPLGAHAGAEAPPARPSSARHAAHGRGPLGGRCMQRTVRPLGARDPPGRSPRPRPRPHGSSAHGRGPEATPHGGRGRSQRHPRRQATPLLEFWNCCCWFVKEIRVSGYPFGFRVSAGFGFGHEFAPELEFGSGSGFKFGFRFWVSRHSTRIEPDPLPSLRLVNPGSTLRANPNSIS